MALTAFIMAVITTFVLTVGRWFIPKQSGGTVNVASGVIWGLVINFAVSFVILYIFLPAMTGWFGGYFAIWFPLSVAVFLAGISAVLHEGEGSSRQEYPITGSVVVGALGLLFIFGICVVAGAYPVYGASALRNIPQIKESSEQVEEASVEHIRLVPQETAAFLGDKVIGDGNLGSLYQVGNYDIQRIRGKLYWAAPLEFRGFWQWLNAGTSPGYVLVNAEEPVQQAELHKEFKMRYLPSAMFGDNLHRFLYENGYSNKIIFTPTFEVDEEMHPWWVISVGHPTTGLGGEVVDGSVIMDPESGKMQYYPLGQTPEWVDRVIPKDLAIEYSNWWGRYVDGFLNTWFSQKGMQQVTNYAGKEDAFLVWGKDDYAKWFIGMTSPSASDKAFTGYIMMNSVTGVTTFYHVNGIGNESSVIKAVNDSVANLKGWHGAQPIFYNIYGAETWLIPVLSENNILQEVALVHAQTLHVVKNVTKQSALADYARWLMEKGSNRAPTQQSQMQDAEGLVVRIGADVSDGKMIYRFVIDTVPNRIFTMDSSVSDKIILTRAGDRVQVQFADTGERTVAVQKFGNVDIEGDVPVTPKTPATVNTPTVSMSPIVVRTPIPTPTPSPTPTPKKYAE